MAKKFKSQKKALGGPILERMDETKYDATGALIEGAAGAAGQLATGNFIGAGAAVLGAGISALIGNKQAKEQNKIAMRNNSQRDLQLATQGMAKGGKVKGRGTGTSDSIPAKLDAGDFIVPAENADKAMEYGVEYLGWKKGQTATTQGGDQDVAISNGEVRFTSDEAEFLEKEMRINLRKLAPNAQGSDVSEAKDGKLSGKALDEEIARRNEYHRQGLGGGNYLPEKEFTGVKDTTTPTLKKMPDWKERAKKAIADNTKKKIDYVGLTEKYGGAAIGAAQAIAGGISAIRSKNKIDNLPQIKGPGAAYNNSAEKVESTTNDAVRQIMLGNESDADRAVGNYMKVARETGGSSSANVLAGAAKAGQGSSENYIKGMTAASQLKLAGTEAATKLRTEGATRETEIQAMNLKNKRDQLNNTLGNANAAIGAGTTNVVSQLMENKYLRDMAAAKDKVDRVNAKKNGGFVKKLKASR